MKVQLAVAGILAISACAQKTDVISLDDIRDNSGDLPGFNTVINCSKAPRIIFDKHGEIVETIHPIRHPSCVEAENKRAAQIKRSQLARGTGPVSNFNQASDDDVPRNIPVATLPDNPDTDQPSQPATDPTQPAPEPAQPAKPSCSDPDSCHSHPDHDPMKNDNQEERENIHGIFSTAGS